VSRHRRNPPRIRAAHWAALICIPALLALAGTLVLSPQASARPLRQLASTESAFVGAANSVRASYGLGEVTVDGDLTRAARAHSADMIAEAYFDHRNLTGRLTAVGAHGRVGETLGWVVVGGDSVGRILEEWLASPTHRAVILWPGYGRIGVGIRVGPFKGYRRVAVITADFEGR
jgi:uncharacterized protein YkwD